MKTKKPSQKKGLDCQIVFCYHDFANKDLESLLAHSVSSGCPEWFLSLYATKRIINQQEYMSRSLPRRTQEKNRLMCGIDPMHPKALRLRVYTGLTYRDSLHRHYMWTGGVRSLLDAFKAFSKTCLINTQEAVEPQADSVSSDGGLSGRGSVSKI